MKQNRICNNSITYFQIYYIIKIQGNMFVFDRISVYLTYHEVHQCRRLEANCTLARTRLFRKRYL